MGRFSVELHMANNSDRELARQGYLPRGQIRQVTIQGVVDTGATRLVIPEAVYRELGLAQTGTVRVRYADGRKAVRKLTSGIHLTCLGRSDLFQAVVEPRRESALLGAVVLEVLDLIPDCTKQRLVPRDPKGIISEIE